MKNVFEKMKNEKNIWEKMEKCQKNVCVFRGLLKNQSQFDGKKWNNDKT